MRAKKPATSSANPCQRCTAILLSGSQRCTLCGWPAGAAYPPGDEQPVLVAVPEVETEVDAAAKAEDVEDHADAQFDALASLAERQTAPAVDPEPIEAELAAEEVAAEAEAEVNAQVEQEVASEVQAPTLVMAAATVVDPLTAPWEQVSGGTGPSAAPTTTEPTSRAAVQERVSTQGDHVAPVPPAATENPTAPAEAAGDDAPSDVPTASWVSTGSTSPLASLTLPTAALVVVGPVLSLITLVVSWLAVRSLAGAVETAFSGGDPNAALGTSGLLGLLGGLVAFASIAAWIAAIVVFLLWVHRARTNVSQLSPVRQRWSPTWSVFGWLIPVAGLYIGWQVLQDLWHGSDPETRHDPQSARPNPQLVTGWLAALAVSLVVSVLTGPLLPNVFALDLLGALLLVGSGVCLAATVRQVAAWQDSATAATAQPRPGTTLQEWPNPAG